MPRSDYRRLHALLDRATPRVRQQVLRALASLQAVFSLAELERLVRAGNVFQIARAIALAESVLSPAAQSLKDIYRSGVALGEAGLPRDVRAMFSLRAGTDAFTLAQADAHAAAFVAQVSTTTRRSIQRVVAQALRESLPPREMAKLIRPLIGLTERQTQAVLTRRLRLQQDGATQAQIQKATQVYSQKLLRQRATTIARTETMRALTDGQQAAWTRAQQTGLLGPARKVWIVTPDDRLCPICAPLDGQQVDLNGTFRTDVGAVTGPPAHPNCRCSTGLVPMAVPVRRVA